MLFIFCIHILFSLSLALITLIGCQPKTAGIRNPNSMVSHKSKSSVDPAKQPRKESSLTPRGGSKSVTKSVSTKSVPIAAPPPPAPANAQAVAPVPKKVAPEITDDGSDPIYIHDNIERDYDMELTVFSMTSLEERFSAFVAVIEEADRMLCAFGVAFYGEFEVIVSDDVRRTVDNDATNPEIMRMRLFAIENRKRFHDPPSLREQVQRYQDMDIVQCYVNALRTDITADIRKYLVELLPLKASKIIQVAKPTALAKMKHPMPMFIRIFESTNTTSNAL
uniref:DUF4476 domain-containing protein n=1 Tax=Panagrellus redivivus TaxID=6233 RepID=A0A7E4W1B0_PANRE